MDVVSLEPTRATVANATTAPALMALPALRLALGASYERVVCISLLAAIDLDPSHSYAAYDRGGKIVPIITPLPVRPGFILQIGL